MDGREALWNEVRALLAGRPQLRTYLSLPPEYETCTPGALHVFYIGHSYTSDGNRAEYGARGRVIGWSSQGTMADILFPGNGGAMFSPVSEHSAALLPRHYLAGTPWASLSTLPVSPKTSTAVSGSSTAGSARLLALRPPTAAR